MPGEEYDFENDQVLADETAQAVEREQLDKAMRDSLDKLGFQADASGKAGFDETPPTAKHLTFGEGSLLYDPGIGTGAGADWSSLLGGIKVIGDVAKAGIEAGTRPSTGGAPPMPAPRAGAVAAPTGAGSARPSSPGTAMTAPVPTLPASSAGLSSGAKVGIAIGAAGGVLLIFGTAVALSRRGTRRRSVSVGM